jgi:hypothetical protein
MMNGKTFGRMAAIVILGTGFVLAGCGRGDAPPAADETQGGMPMAHGEGAGGMTGMEGMHMDPAMMQRHAQEADTTASGMQAHVARMRQLPPEQQHAQMGDHAARVSRMLGMMQRQDREMDMGMGMSDEQMGAMMGMSGEEHRRMMDQMQAVRAEVEALQTASLAEMRGRMAAHLDRLEALTGMVQRSAEHMGSD